MGVIIDQYIVPKDLSGTARMCMLLIAIYGVTVLLTWLQTFVMINVALKTIQKYDKIFLRKSKRFLYGSLMCVPKVI